MAKIIIPFNNKNFEVDEASISAAYADLKSHLSTTMSGSGETVSFDGITYSIDATKLSNARNSFVSHLGTIAGNGSKVVVNGIEYNVGSDKISGSISELETVLENLHYNEGDGSDILDNTFPIEFNSLDVVNNSAFEYNGVEFVRISEKVLTEQEIINGSITVVYDGRTFNGSYGGMQTLLGCTAASYVTGMLSANIISVPSIVEINGVAVKTGLYIQNFGKMLDSNVYLKFETVSNDGSNNETDVVFDEHTLNFHYNSSYGFYMSSHDGTNESLGEDFFALEDGQTYRVKWDGEYYTVTAYGITLEGIDYVSIGNEAYLKAFVQGQSAAMTEPFCIWYTDRLKYVTFVATDAADAHTMAIYKAGKN